MKVNGTAVMKSISSKFLIAIFIAFPSWASATESFRIESKIIFNTACARCHEGECSGRMSFHLEKSAADKHIQRYAGEISAQTTQQLFELLRYMKEECSFYPFEHALVNDQKWSSDTLAKFHSVSQKAYFIPLGQLDSGSYQLNFDGFNDTTNSCIEIINQQFDFIDKEKVNDENERLVLQFQVDESSGHYLRIRANAPITVNQLELFFQQKNKQ